MAQNLPIPVQSPSAIQPLITEASSVPLSTEDRFDQMFGRMRGTMTITGDIVNPDPEMWNCESE